MLLLLLVLVLARAGLFERLGKICWSTLPKVERSRIVAGLEAHQQRRKARVYRVCRRPAASTQQVTQLIALNREAKSAYTTPRHATPPHHFTCRH